MKTAEETNFSEHLADYFTSRENDPDLKEQKEEIKRIVVEIYKSKDKVKDINAPFHEYDVDMLVNFIDEFPDLKEYTINMLNELSLTESIEYIFKNIDEVEEQTILKIK